MSSVRSFGFDTLTDTDYRILLGVGVVGGAYFAGRSVYTYMKSQQIESTSDKLSSSDIFTPVTLLGRKFDKPFMFKVWNTGGLYELQNVTMSTGTSSFSLLNFVTDIMSITALPPMAVHKPVYSEVFSGYYLRDKFEVANTAKVTSTHRLVIQSQDDLDEFHLKTGIDITHDYSISLPLVITYAFVDEVHTMSSDLLERSYDGTKVIATSSADLRKWTRDEMGFKSSILGGVGCVVMAALAGSLIGTRSDAIDVSV
jgi:hypothetical protein